MQMVGNFKRLVLLILLYTAIYTNSLGQNTPNLNDLDRMFKAGQYSDVISLSEKLIQKCSTLPAPIDCSDNQYMSKIYAYKGYSEYKLWEKEKNKSSFQNSIRSLKRSQEIYAASNVSFRLGIFEMEWAILEKHGADLNGVSDAWRGILGLHAEKSWKIDKNLLNDIIVFLHRLEDLTITPPDSAHTAGDFASFMVQLACDLTLSGGLDTSQTADFNFHKKLATEDGNNLRGNLWWYKALDKISEFPQNSTDSLYILVDEYLGWALKYAKYPTRKIFVLNERAKLAIKMQETITTYDRERLLNNAWEWSREAYEIQTKQSPELAPEKVDEVKQVYGIAVTRLVRYYVEEVKEFKIANIERALLIGRTLLTTSKKLDGTEESELSFTWNGCSFLYYYLSLAATRRGKIEKFFAIEMATKAWETRKREEGITTDQEICGLPATKAAKIIDFAENLYETANSFEDDATKVYIQYFVSCLNSIIKK